MLPGQCKTMMPVPGGASVATSCENILYEASPWQDLTSHLGPTTNHHSLLILRIAATGSTGKPPWKDRTINN
ncbi:hypothetical protein ATANTOWER_009930 [Ataeniobius toweri]|uniref:Uncharacterized protein n=1 Tax=Ataeniobius toweri TaxID=208326 RepID=A0ABU7ANU6_9TELE|nr:hypothetical protein [Ataeniobius toweri]